MVGSNSNIKLRLSIRYLIAIVLLVIMVFPYLYIADYYQIDPDYGTMEDFERFIQEAKTRGIRVIADLVLNHTSSEHAWFKESRSSRTNPKRDWYIWKDAVNGGVPNNWESFLAEQRGNGMLLRNSITIMGLRKNRSI